MRAWYMVRTLRSMHLTSRRTCKPAGQQKQARHAVSFNAISTGRGVRVNNNERLRVRLQNDMSDNFLGSEGV
jgi:hypothetical protein